MICPKAITFTLFPVRKENPSIFFSTPKIKIYSSTTPSTTQRGASTPRIGPGIDTPIPPKMRLSNT
jgi:hypothetical protein